MNKLLKAFLIIIIILLCVGAYIFLDHYEKENNDISTIQNTSTSNDSIAEPVIEHYKDYSTKKMGRTTTELNLRKDWNTESDVLMVIPNKAIVYVIGETIDGWYKVEYGENTGFVYAEYLYILNDEEVKEYQVKKEFEDTYAKVTTELNIRERPNTNGQRLTTVKSIAILKIIKQMENGWYYVEGNTIEGYVNPDYVIILSNEEYSLLSSKENNMVDPQNNVIAQYTSTSTYNENSRYNMHLAADYINGIVVEPGETYSHLSGVHPEGVENIYKISTVYVAGGKTAQASGGGICQTSSTVYAAIASAKDKGINTGLYVSEQEIHSGPVSYVPRNYEATVSTGSIDFCFRNCNDFAIKIVTSYNWNTLTVKIVKI